VCLVQTKKQRREAGAKRRRDRHHHHRRQLRDERCVSCTTFNILAPIYKRMENEVGWILLCFPFWRGIYLVSFGLMENS
jgi:hypothetical protein